MSKQVILLISPFDKPNSSANSSNKIITESNKESGIIYHNCLHLDNFKDLIKAMLNCQTMLTQTPFNTILLLLDEQNLNDNFLDFADQFYDVFGIIGIKMLQIAIPKKGNDEKTQLNASFGYNFLLKKLNICENEFKDKDLEGYDMEDLNIPSVKNESKNSKSLELKIKVHQYTYYKEITEFGDPYEKDVSKSADLMINFIEKIKMNFKIDELKKKNNELDVTNKKNWTFIEYLKSLIDLQNDLVINQIQNEKTLGQFFSSKFGITNFERSKTEYAYSFGFHKVYVYSGLSDIKAFCEKIKECKIKKIYFLLDNLVDTTFINYIRTLSEISKISHDQLNNFLEIHYQGNEDIEVVKKKFDDSGVFDYLGLNQQSDKKYFMETKLFIRENFLNTTYLDWIRNITPTFPDFIWSYELVIGSGNEDFIRRFLDKKFKIKYDKAIDSYRFGSTNMNVIYVNCNLNEPFFDLKNFTEKVEEMKSKISRIYLLESLNEERLKNDTEKIKSVLDTTQLKTSLDIYINCEENIDKIKIEISKYTLVLDILGLNEETEKNNFINNNIFDLKKILINPVPGYIWSFKLVVGSTTEDNLQHFFKLKFAIDYDKTQDLFTYDRLGTIWVYVNCNFHRMSFNFNGFLSMCEKYRSKISRIYLLENLNPRPETLEKDINILSRVFTQKELRDYIKIYFTGQNENLDAIKTDFEKFNCFFNYLGIDDEMRKKEFARDNLFSLIKKIENIV